MMARIYDKRAELERDERRRANEERRWRHEAGCPILAAVERDELAECRGACPHCQRWDGVTRVTRIEFQIRGGVIKEYGLRDPSRALDVQTALDDRGRLRVIGHRVAVDADGVVLGLVDRLDWLWRSCIDWVRLVELEYTDADPTKLKPASRLPLDERWKLLQEVKFAAARAPHPIRRFRVRAAASAAMGLGVALAQAARDGELVRWAENTGAYDAETAEAMLRERITKIKQDEAERIVQWLIEDKGGAIGALVHLSVRNNAARRRFKERIVGDAALSTGPPDGDGAGTRATARGGGAHQDGSREAGRAVA